MLLGPNRAIFLYLARLSNRDLFAIGGFLFCFNWATPLNRILVALFGFISAPAEYDLPSLKTSRKDTRG